MMSHTCTFGLCLLIFACLEIASSESGCTGPFPHPSIHDFKLTETPLLVEAKVTSEFPTTFNWQIRQWYDGEEWPYYKNIDYFIPDGDFGTYSERTGNTTLVRLDSESFPNATIRVRLQIIVQYPCATLHYIANAFTLQLIAAGTVRFPLIKEVPKEVYFPTPGEELRVPLKTIFLPGPDYGGRYRFDRFLRQDENRLAVDQRLDDISLYRLNEKGVSYPKKFKKSSSGDGFNVDLKLTPWTEADSGIFISAIYANHAGEYWDSFPNKLGRNVETLVYSFFELRGQGVIKPSIIVYNEVDWMFRGKPDLRSDGSYLVPLNRKSTWEPSVMFIAYGVSTTLRTTSQWEGFYWQPYNSGTGSSVIGFSTVKAVGMSISKENTRKYRCYGYADSGRNEEVSVTIQPKWYTPVKIVSYSPRRRYIEDDRGLIIRCTAKGDRNTTPLLKFYFLNDTFKYYPKDKTYPTEHEYDEVKPLASTPGVSLTITRDDAQNQVTGVLIVQNPYILRRTKAIQCYAADDNSFDRIRFWPKLQNIK